MAEHYRRNVLEVMKWCNACMRKTYHKVSHGKAGHCLSHSPKKQKQEKPKKQEERLF